MKREKIDDYMLEHEFWQEDEVKCPYCDEIQELDPSTLYNVQDDEIFECQSCGRKFKLNSGYDWWYTTTPVEEEVIKILEEEGE